MGFSVGAEELLNAPNPRWEQMGACTQVGRAVQREERSEGGPGRKPWGPCALDCLLRGASTPGTVPSTPAPQSALQPLRFGAVSRREGRPQPCLPEMWCRRPKRHLQLLCLCQGAGSAPQIPAA